MTTAMQLPSFRSLALIDHKKLVESLQGSSYDTLVLVSSSYDLLKTNYNNYHKLFSAHNKYTTNFQSSGNCTTVVSESTIPHKTIYASTGPIRRDYDDVRAFKRATLKALHTATSSGSKRIAIACIHDNHFPSAFFVTVAAALDVNYLPSDVRTDGRKMRFEEFGVIYHNPQEQAEAGKVQVLDHGKSVAKDIVGGEPEQYTPIKVQQYVQNLFSNSSVKVTVHSSDTLVKDFPLLAAVDRGCEGLDRHRGCMIELEYSPPGATETVFFVGKGITFDTGGADLKISGAMRLMSRDKGGAATVAGFLKIVDEVKPKNLRVVGLMAMARNDIGPACYVCDELIKSRSGVKICVGNTDAEGRMAMADVLCYAREKALNAPNPALYTIATLTGHVGIVYGSGYAAVLQNGPASKAQIGESLHKCGFDNADPIEISQIRKEDYDFIMYSGDRADILQCNTLPSSRTPRGHNFPAAFLIHLAGLDKHGNDSTTKPIPYCHIDIASAIDSPDESFMDHPQAASLTALARNYNLC